MRLNRREVLRGGIAVGLSAAMGKAEAIPYGPSLPSNVVKTRSGAVRGYFANGGIFVFKGVPYGMDTAMTRFAAPKPVAAWSGVRECTLWGPRAPQVLGARPETEVERKAVKAGYFLPPDEGVQREDCLHLNVWTPELRDVSRRDGKKRPVMFYIHGGAFANGTANAALYDGTRLARLHDVVVVTVNID